MQWSSWRCCIWRNNKFFLWGKPDTTSWCCDNSHYLRDINHNFKTLKPFQRRSVEALDDTIGGLNGFIMLKEIVEQYMGRRIAILEKFEQGKCYRKISFPQHCTDFSECPSYCINLSLFKRSTFLGPWLCLCWIRRSFWNNRWCFAEIHQNVLKNKDDLLYNVNILKAGLIKWM